MSARELGAVAFRVIGIWILVGIAIQAPMALQRNTTWEPGLLVSFAMTWAVAAVLAILLLLFAPTLARILIPHSEALQISVTAVELQWIAFAVVGLAMLIAGVRGVAGLGLLLLEKRHEWEGESALTYLWMYQPDALVTALIQTGAGALLLIGRDRLSDAWRWVGQAWQKARGRDREEAD